MSYYRDIIAAALQDKSVYKRLKRSGFRSRHFKKDEVAQFIYKKITSTFDYEINVELLKEMIQEDSSLSEEDSFLYVQEIERMEKQDISSVDASISYLDKKRKDIELQEVLLRVSEERLRDRDVNDVLNTLERSILKINSSLDFPELNDYFKTVNARDAQRIAMAVSNSSGIKITNLLQPFAPYFPRGIANETITAIEGPTNAGKSVALANFLHMALHPENGLNCLYVFSENREIEALSRLDSIFLNKKYDEIYKGKLNSKEKLVFKEAKDKGYGRLIAVRAPFENFDSELIKKILDECYDDGINIQAIFVDSPDHMQPSLRHNVWYLNKYQVWADLKALAEGHQVPIMGTRPATARSTDKDKKDSTMGAGGYQISLLLDNIIALNFNPGEDMTTGIRKFQVTKVRDGVFNNDLLYFRLLDSLRLVPENTFEEATKKINNQTYIIETVEE